MSKTNTYAPTEEELVSLGFTGSYHKGFVTNGIPAVLYFPNRIFFVGNPNIEEGWVEFYPKSLEELRLLISMMRP